MKDNINRPYKGLHRDSSKQDQPKDTYLFALNAINETELGDINFLSNEESNELCDNISQGFIPLGKIYIGNNETVILSVKEDDSVSEIGILNDSCNYSIHVNDKDSDEEDKLNFKVNKQIQGFYRLRRGCEKTIYFTDDNERPRYFNFDSPEDFKNEDGTWNSGLFSLQKIYSKIPHFQDIEVLDTGGNLEPGSYNVAIQYVDESLNPTEWITTSPVIKIYNDLSNKEYREINGSINSDTDYINFPTTSKAIRVEFSTLDFDFLYYRLAFIEANSGSGQITGVKYTDVIPTSKDFFIYTGSNAVGKGTETEILLFTDIIERAKTIAHLEGRLELGNTQGKQINFCRLQKYASRIKADCVTKLVSLNDANLDKSNPKNPVHEFGGLGYMPGEIYSFGIIYIFEDGSLSPVYHIPGKNTDIDENMVFSPGDSIYPMSQENKISTTYNDNDDCSNSGYWGRDSEGIQLKGKPIRHHRFPLRSKINVPLVQDEFRDEQNVSYYKVFLTISGKLITPVECPKTDPDCGSDEVFDFEVRATYAVDGEKYTFTENIDPDFYANTQPSYQVDITENSQFHGSNNITIESIEISDIKGNFQVISSNSPSAVYNNEHGDYFIGSADITTDVVEHTGTIQGRAYYTQVLGIKFSGIDLPSETDVNGNKIVGYHIVRNERTEFDKTILDSAVMIPSVVNEKYIGHGLLMPETDKLSEDVFGLLHPEHKFNNKEYYSYDEIIQEGEFQIVDRKYGKINYDDVYDGSSFNADKQKDGNDDGNGTDGSPTSRGYDGWSLNVISRDNIVSYKSKSSFTLEVDDFKERFYLEALGNKSINDNANDVYNITTDNKIGMIQTKGSIITPSSVALPYVILKKQNLDSYSNFRTLPYYKQTINPRYFDLDSPDPNDEICTVFGGDTYVSPMRYVNTMFYDNRVAKRAGKRGLFKIIFGAIIAIVGAVLSVFTAGASTVLIGTGIALIGAGALFLNSGLKMENFNRTYNDEYDKGLRRTSLDNWVDAFYNYRKNAYTQSFGFKGSGGTGNNGPSDDTIQWIGDCVTDLWFETSVNTNLRCHMAIGDSPTFLNAPGKIESGNNEPIGTWRFSDLYYTSSNSQRYPVSALERHLATKLLAFDQTRDDNRYYIGVALGEFYFINPDYQRGNKQKIYSHLPLEYDCCSECQEDFPHRWYWSEQSFQEELSDNFRVFLPNNYRDIPGETGEVTNIFSIGNDLFIHTEEALWMQPRNYQERVTDQVVSFIGTGSYADIPPRKVVDDKTGMSAGLQHQWSAINTKHGYFFVSENEGKIYHFDGRKLMDISSQGMTDWFKENIELISDRNYYTANGEKYPYTDNPSNPFGAGFISVYDSRKERVIFTKKDFAFKDGVIDGDVAISVCNGKVIQFPNYSQIIAGREGNGWTFVGIEDCRMKFEKTVLETVEEEREVTVTIPNTADIHIFFDISGSFGAFTDNCLQSINQAVDNWLVNFGSANPDWNGNVYKYQDSTERWVNYANVIANKTYGGTTNNKDIVVISFCNETDSDYHGSSLETTIANPSATFTADYNNFVNNIYPAYNSFLGIHYPIVFGQNSGMCGILSGGGSRPESKNFLLHSIAALWGVPMTSGEVASELATPNPGFTTGEWTQLTNALQEANPYPDNGLNNFGWIGKWDRAADADGNVINDSQFEEDINKLLAANITTEVITVKVTQEVLQVESEEGVVADDAIQYNNSWTMSYALPTSNRKSSWVSWHSYLPNFYFNTVNKFYSWIHGNDGIWKHNKLGHYQTFYGVYHPHIIEYTSLSSPLVTRVWDYFKLLTEAKRYVEDYKEYVDERFVTFNKAILYNTRQCSGLLNLKVKDTEIDDEDYLLGQIVNGDDVIVDRNERDWTINNFRDIRVDYTLPIWNSNIDSLQNEYFIDKVLNESSLDVNKDWTQMESFRDKYLVIRLIFDKFANIKLLTNYLAENETQSFR